MTSEYIVKGLSIFGGTVLIMFVFLFALMFWEWLKDQIAMAKYRYKRKHRFDKDPVAECYCKDCACYLSSDGYCTTYRRCMRDNNFCSLAKPNKRDPEKKKI